MQRLRKFFLLSFEDRRLLLRSAILLALIRAGLLLLPFRIMRRLLARATRTGSAPVEDINEVARLVWAVETIHNNIPLLKNCLSEAFAAQVLLARKGQPSTLRIGVARSASGRLKAHAWVEIDGRVVIGGAQSPLNFVPLPPLEQR